MPDETLTRPLAELRAEEAALLQRILEKDERAIEALYERYSGPLYSLAYQVTGADRFAQEVVQEVFVTVWKQAGRFDPSRGSLSSWLFTLARHKAIDLVRKEANVRRHVADVDLEFEESDDDVDQEAWLRLRRDTVRAAITSLPEAQRTALELAFFRGLTHVEVAETLGIPLGTAKTRIRTALLRLRDILGQSVSEMDARGPIEPPDVPRAGGRCGARRPRLDRGGGSGRSPGRLRAMPPRCRPAQRGGRARRAGR